MECKIGVTGWQLPCEPEDCLYTARQAGLSYVQLDLGPSGQGWPLSDPEVQQKILKSREETGVEILSVVLNDLCQNGFVRPVGDERRAVAGETMRRGVEAAAALGVPSICVPSFFDNEIREPADYERTVEALISLCRHAQQYGILVYTENVLGAEALCELFSRVSCSNLRLLFDTQNYSFMANRSAGPLFRSVKGLVGDFLHIKDGINALGDAPLGKGTSGFTDTLSAIADSGFGGVFLLENRYDSVEDLKKEAEVFRQLYASLSA